jgi:hypothetical protein
VADANKQRSIPGSEWTQIRAAESASRAMREYLASLDDAWVLVVRKQNLIWS